MFLTLALSVTVSLAKSDQVQSSRTSDQQLLEQGKAFEREITQGEIHSFRLGLKAGEFTHVVVRQLGVNVVVTLIAPDGNKLLEADIPRSSQEPEWITYLASTVGEYRVEVRTVDKGVPPGRYEIKVEEQRGRRAPDEERLSAQRVFTEGTRRFGEQDYKGAIEKYQEAFRLYHQSARRVEEAVTLNCLARANVGIYQYPAAIKFYENAETIYRELSDLQGEGTTLNEKGNTFLSVGSYKEAISSYERALEVRRKSHYRAGEAGTLGNLATAYRNLNQYEKSIAIYEQSIAISRELKDRRVEARALKNLGSTYRFLNKYEKAIECYDQALTIFREIKDRAGESDTLSDFAVLYDGVGQSEKSVSYLEQSLTIKRELKDKTGEATILNNLGTAYNSLSQSERAIQCLEQSIAISREINDRDTEGRALTNLGITYYSLSRYEKAIEYYEQALAIKRESSDGLGSARALSNIGLAYNGLSQYEKAIKYYELALALFKETKNRTGEGRTLNNLGLAHRNLSRYEKSIEYYEQSLAISREVKDRDGEARVLNNLGITYYSIGQYAKAIEQYERSLQIFKEIKNRAGEASVLNSLGETSSALNRYEQAIKYYEQSLAVSREVMDRQGEAGAVNNLGGAYYYLGQYQKATGYFEQALAIVREVKDRAGEGIVLNDLGEAYVASNHYDRATEYYEQSLAISREVKDQTGQARTLANLMLVWDRRNDKSAAILYGKEAVNVFQMIRGQISMLDAESRQSYLKSHEDTYRKLSNLLISQGRLAEAEKVLELLKEEEFNRIIRRSGSTDLKIGFTRTETEATKIYDELATLASERGTLLAKVANKTATDQDRQRLDLIEARIIDANKKIKNILAEVAKASPDQKEITQQSQSMMQSLRRLGPGVVALYTVITNDKGWVILTTSDFRRAYPIDTTDLNQTISDFRLTLRTDRYDPVPLAKKLYSALFLQKNDDQATLAADLRAYHARILMWSLDGVLRYVPINALHDGKRYLIESYPNIVFTTASLTRLLDQTSANWRAFGLGVSKEHNEFPALPSVPQELHSIIKESGVANSMGVLPGVIKLDEQFTRQSMIDGLREGYPLVHIASHFRFIEGREETSYLLLGDGSNLSVEDMQNSPGIFEGVELLTLSACDTATVATNGKDVEGLAFVAQDLGAKAVVASLWPVADVGTEVLMREFYQLRGTNAHWSKAEALRQAQIALLKGKDSSSKRANPENRDIKIAAPDEIPDVISDYRRDAKAPFAHPHYWAPFILIGNWK